MGKDSPTAGMLIQTVTVPDGHQPGQPLKVTGRGGAVYSINVPSGFGQGDSFRIQLPERPPLGLKNVASGMWYYIKPGMRSKWEGAVALEKLRELQEDGVRCCRKSDFHIEWNEPADATRVYALVEVLKSATAQAVANLVARVPGASHNDAEAALIASGYHAGKAVKVLRESVKALSEEDMAVWYYIKPGMRSQWEGPVAMQMLRGLPNADGTRCCRKEDFKAEWSEPADATRVCALTEVLNSGGPPVPAPASIAAAAGVGPVVTGVILSGEPKMAVAVAQDMPMAYGVVVTGVFVSDVDSDNTALHLPSV